MDGKNQKIYPVKEGETLIVDVKDKGDKGDGLAFMSGLAIFIPDAKKGSKVEIKITETRPRFARGELIKVVEDVPET